MRIKSPAYLNNVFFSHLLEYLLVLAGCFILALGFNIFLAPNHIASGGVVGVSIIVKEITGLQPAIIQWVLNIPLFFIGMIIFGAKYSLKTALGSFTLPLFILLTSNLQPITTNPMLASVFGGLGVGLGLGIVFRGKASTGGFSILAQILNRYLGQSIGKATVIIDFVVIITSAFVFDTEKALFALISLYITGKAIDFVQLGFNYSKVAFVISEKDEAISQSILNNLDRGVTKLSGSGGYTGDEKNVLMVVMGSTEVIQFKNLVKAEDPFAFIIISETNEVLGKGFQLAHHNETLGMKSIQK